MSLTPSADEQAYVKQLRNVDPNYLPLYDPNPWSEDYVYIGDVGVIHHGTFRPLFNITMKPTQRRNAWGVPENFEILPFSSSSDASIRDDPSVIKKYEPCFGDPNLIWNREDDSKSGTEEETETAGERRDKEYTRCAYTFTKNSPESSYVLLAMSDVQETAVQETQMEVWRHYMEKHHKHWLKYIRKKWRDPNFKAENLVLLCGVIKTSSWVIATLPKEGVYRLVVQDTPVGIQPTLTLEGKSVDNGIRYGQDTIEGDREIMQHFAKLAGLRVPDSREPIRKRCLFLRGFRMEKDFWSPKRIVAAAEPEDPRPSHDGDDFRPPFRTRTSNQRCDRACEDDRYSCRCGSEPMLQVIRRSQTPKTAPTACPPCPPLKIPLDYTPRHLRCLFSAPEASSSSPIPTVVF